MMIIIIITCGEAFLDQRHRIPTPHPPSPTPLPKGRNKLISLLNNKKNKNKKEREKKTSFCLRVTFFGRQRCQQTLAICVQCCTTKTTARRRSPLSPVNTKWKWAKTCVSCWGMTGTDVWDISPLGGL